MHLTDILRHDMVWHELEARSKETVLAELCGKIAGSMAGLDAHALEMILTEREKLGSTGIQDGIAIPHGKINGIDKMIVAFGRSSSGIDFDAHDGKPTHLFFVLLAPEFAAGQHLKTLARLSRMLKEASFRKRLLEAGDTDEIYHIIVEEDGKL